MAEEKKCAICEKIYPATPKYFYRYRNGLRPYCKKCESKRTAEYKKQRRQKATPPIPDKCKTCQKLDSKKGKCMVLIEFLEDCWSWTGDADWLRKVREAVEKYSKTQGIGL